MNLELSVTSAAAKARAIATLEERGFRAGPGPVRLAYPFAILVEDVAGGDETVVTQLVSSVDPCAGRITLAAQPDAS